MSIDTTRKSVTPATTISMMAIADWPAIIFGLPFMIAGGFITAASLGIIPCDDSKFHASRQLVAVVGGLFFLAGFWVSLYGLGSLLQRMEKQRLAKNWPGEIWRADYRWDPRGADDQGIPRLQQGFLTNVIGAAFIIPFTWITFSIKQAPSFARIFICLFDLMLLWTLMSWFYQIFQRLKYKTSRLEYSSFPFFLGEKMETMLSSGASLKDAQDLNVTLRCIEEKYETRGTGKNRSQVVVAYQIYAETLTFADLRRYGQDRLRIPLSFSLPADPGLETRLRDRPAVYWELVVKAKTPGIDYAANFLVPIYRK